MKKKLNTVHFGVCLFIFIMMIFQNYFQSIFTPLKSLDEIIPIILFIIVGFKVFIDKDEKMYIDDKILTNNIKILVCLLLLFILGIIGSFKNNYQPYKLILQDGILIFKGFYTYLFASFLFSDISFDDYYEKINIMLKLISIIVFSLIIINYIFNIFPTGDIRNGIKTQQLFFSHATYLASFSVVIITLLTFLYDKYNENIYYIIMMAFVAISTQRAKVLAYIAIYLLMYYFVIKKQIKINTKTIFIISIIALCVGWDKLVTYLSNPTWARTALTMKSFIVANDHFPFGSGFATFGTWISGVNYSPLYSTYGLDKIYGLKEDDFIFLGDVYWPAIIAQFGYFGVIATIYIIFLIYKNIGVNTSRYKYFGKLGLLMYLLILSTSETSFMSPVGPLMCLILAL